MRPPNYYKNFFKEVDQAAFNSYRKDQRKKLRQYKDDNTPARLATRETCTLARLQTKKRGFEDAS